MECVHFSSSGSGNVFEPAMMADGALADWFGWLVGTGAGAGMGLMFVFTAVIGCLTGLSGYLFPALRYVENDLPDFDEGEPLVIEAAVA